MDTSGTNHQRLRTLDCIMLFNSWMYDDLMRQGEMRQRVGKFSDESEFRELVKPLCEGDMVNPYYSLYRVFLAGFFMGQDDGIKLMESVAEESVARFLEEVGCEDSVPDVMDKISQELDGDELTASRDVPA